MNINVNKTFSELIILNWNANGIKAKRGAFLEFLSRHNVAVACVTETHLIHPEKFTVPGYNIYRTDHVTPEASDGVAIIIRKKYTASLNTSARTELFRSLCY